MASKQEEKYGGYDVSFVDPLEKDYECPICLLAVRDPVQTPCGHTFCKTCFDQIAEQQGGSHEVECPLDKEKLAKSKVFDDVKVRRKVLSLKVKCINKSSHSVNFCEWIGELNYLQNHHNKCKFQIVGCPRDCGNNMQRCELSQHQLFTCPRLPITCGSCEEIFEMRNMERHKMSCPKLPINCTLKCGKKMERRNLNDHVSELGDCPNTIMPCIFKDVGCDITVKRHEMDQHLTTAVVHHQIKQHQIVKTLIDENKALRDENKTLRDEKKNLRDENKTLRDETKQIKETLHFVNSALIQLFSSQSEDLVSYCGKTIVRFTVSNGKVPFKQRKHFFAHSNGYKVALEIWSMGGDVCATLVPVRGDRDHELRWPFRLRHTITLVGRQHHEDDIKRTIDPATLNDQLIKFYYHQPIDRHPYIKSIWLRNLRCRTASLCVAQDVLFTEKYLKNEEIIIVVEVDN